MNPYYQDEQVTLYHADCREILPSLDDESIEVVITDPPYSVSRNDSMLGFMSPNADEKATHSRGYADHDERAFAGLMIPAMEQVERVLKPGGNALIFMGNPTLAEAGKIITDSGLKIFDLIAYTWSGGLAKATSMLCPAMELAMLTRKPGQLSQINPTWKEKNVRGGSKTRGTTGHPTEKPISWMEDAVLLLTNPGDVVLDPFAGSGTTLRAAKNCGRKAIGIEREEKYCELAANRLAQEVLFA